ncbi:MAG: VPLPA-CTERM sorting domain-containing protein [Pseudomonadota bacterium]
MMKLTLLRGLAAGALTLCVAGAHAASNSFQDPATAAWGGWTRGDAGTVYTHWEEFDSCTPSGPFCEADPDSVPDAGNLGATTAIVIPNNPGAIVTGNGTGGNIYSFGDTPDFDIVIQPSTTPTQPVRVALQVAVLGTDVDDSSVLLNGQAFDQKIVLESFMGGPPFGGVDNEYLYLWLAAPAAAAYSFDLIAQSSSLSLDALSVDLAPVPLPAAAWLFGSAILGVLAIRRRRRTMS